MRKTALISALLALAVTGCAPEAETETRGRRGSIGKADHTGSCALSCDGKSGSGSCWCDDQCESYGDCCADYEEICEATDPGFCGGFAGFTCEDDQFCSYTEQAICGWADATGTCESKPDACPEFFAPVCGCNGQTYDNGCFANAMGTSVASEGACEPNPGQPLCLSDNDCPSIEFCDTSECLSDCPPGMVCPAVCKGVCTAKPIEPPPIDGPSCAGQCGGAGPENACWCDSDCVGYGDCCEDYVTICE